MIIVMEKAFALEDAIKAKGLTKVEGNEYVDNKGNMYKCMFELRQGNEIKLHFCEVGKDEMIGGIENYG